jgi:hypothetical protein
MSDKQTQPARSEESSPLQVVQAQVDAYNRGDIDAFLNTYAPEVNLYNFPDELLSSGLASMRENYAKLFEKAPQLHASITNRSHPGQLRHRSGGRDGQPGRKGTHGSWRFTR